MNKADNSSGLEKLQQGPVLVVSGFHAGCLNCVVLGKARGNVNMTLNKEWNECKIHSAKNISMVLQTERRKED